MTLVEFLRARLDADEQAAHAAAGRTWRTEDSESEDVFVLTEDDEYVVGLWDGGQPSGGATVDDAAHIARHDPARVLAEVEAKWRIVELMAEEDAAGSGLTDAAGLGRSLRALAVLRLLGLPYADHPDYDPSWRPE